MMGISGQALRLSDDVLCNIEGFQIPAESAHFISIIKIGGVLWVYKSKARNSIFIFRYSTMSTRFSIPGAPLISNIGPSVVRTSRVVGTNVVGAPLGGVAATTIGEVAYPAVIGSTLTSPAIRGSRVISPSEIPPGADMIRVENPPEYIYHNAPAKTQTTRTVVTRPPPPPAITQIEERRMGATGCPWWCWLLLGLLALILLAGIIYGCLMALRARDDGSSANAGRSGDNGNQAAQTGGEQADAAANVRQQEQASPLPPARQYRNTTSVEEKAISKRCEQGFFVFNGRCLQCPAGSSWNGANCVIKDTVSNNYSTTQNKSAEEVLSQVKTGQQDGQSQPATSETGSTATASSSQTSTSTASPEQGRGADERDQQGGPQNDRRGEQENPAPNGNQEREGNNEPGSEQGPGPEGPPPGEQYSNSPNGPESESPQRPDENDSNRGQKTTGSNHVGGGARDAVSDAAQGVRSGVSSVASTTGNAASRLWQGAKSLGRGAAKTAGDAAASTWEGAKSVGRGAANIAGDAARTAGDAASNTWQGVKDVGRALSHKGMIRRMSY